MPTHKERRMEAAYHIIDIEEYRDKFWERVEEKRRRQEEKHKTLCAITVKKLVSSRAPDPLQNIFGKKRPLPNDDFYYAKRLPPPKDETLYDIYAKPTITLKKT